MQFDTTWEGIGLHNVLILRKVGQGRRLILDLWSSITGRRMSVMFTSNFTSRNGGVKERINIFFIAQGKS